MSTSVKQIIDQWSARLTASVLEAVRAAVASELGSNEATSPRKRVAKKKVAKVAKPAKPARATPQSPAKTKEEPVAAAAPARVVKASRIKSLRDWPAATVVTTPNGVATSPVDPS